MKRKTRIRGGAYADFMAQAYTMEIEASQRYTEFAEQMEVHNNVEVAQLFRKLAAIEGLHAKQILDEMGWPQMPEPVYALQWAGGEPPESAPVTELHYLMQPWHALELALDNEKRAEKFLAGIAARVRARRLKCASWRRRWRRRRPSTCASSARG